MLNDELLMARAVCGDVNAFGLIVKAHQERMQRFAYRMLGDREAASDVVQDALVRIWRARASYTPSGSMAGFFLRVTRNACIDYIRANRRWDTVRLEEDIPFTGSSCEASILSLALHDAVSQALLRLPEAQRAVFALSEYEGLSYAEISEVVGCPPGTVASRKYAAMEALRTHLRPWLEGEEA